MMVKQLIYDSCMIVKKETIISIYHDIQVVHKKHDGMIVVFLTKLLYRALFSLHPFDVPFLSLFVSI